MNNPLNTYLYGILKKLGLGESSIKVKKLYGELPTWVNSGWCLELDL